MGVFRTRKQLISQIIRMKLLILSCGLKVETIIKAVIIAFEISLAIKKEGRNYKILKTNNIVILHKSSIYYSIKNKKFLDYIIFTELIILRIENVTGITDVCNIIENKEILFLH